MAKVSSTASARPASRQSQGAPQDVPASAPARATRSTRSQSREPSEQPSTGRGKGNKNAAPKKTGGRKKNAAAELATVEEDAPQNGPVEDVEDENQNIAEMEEEQDVAVDALDARRMSVGAMSGTTAKTSFSQEEIGGLDPDVMVDVLPNLASASNDLAKLLLPADPKSRPVVRKEIRKSGTKYNKLFHNRCAAIAIHKRSFGSTDYIQPSIVLRALLGVQYLREVSQGPWRPDNIIYKINLAQMLRTLLITLPDNSIVYPDGYDETSNLDVNFGSGIAGPVFSPRAFDMCLSFLTQLSIIRMTALFTDPAFSPTRTIVEAFYTSDEDGSPIFKHASVLHMADIDGDQQVAYTQAIQQRVDQLTDLFNEADPSSWAQSLAMSRVQFTWDEFLDQVIQYYLERSKEIDDEIDAAGGKAQIMSSLAEEVDRHADARKATEKRQSFTRPSGTPKKGFGKAAIRKLKAREKDLAANAMIPPASAPVAQMTQPDFGAPEQTAPPALDDGWIRHEDDNSALPSEQMQSTAKSSLAALSGIQNIQRQNAAKGKGRSFIDPQPGATRVSFDDSQSQTAQYEVPGYQRSTQSGPYYQSPSRNAAKRPHAEVDNDEDFEPTQDQGFETDMRDTAAADQRRRELPPPTRAPQPRFSGMGSAVPGPSAFAQNSPNKRARKNPGSSIPAPMQPFDPDDEREIPMTGSARLNQARINSRHYTVMAVSRKPTQVRTPWTSAEEEALIDYIVQEGEGGVQYAKIKQLDAQNSNPMLARRSAEDIRFKCRNMKETFLKGHSELPANFEHIVLDKKAIEKLQSLGIPYEQDAIRARPVLDE